MRKLEKNSRKKQRAQHLYGNSELSIREIASEIKVDEKTVRNWIAKGNWARKSAAISAEFRESQSLGDAAAKVVAQIEIEQPAQVVAPRAASDIAKDFCGTVDVLRAELDVVIRNLRLLQEIADADVYHDGEKATAARRRLLAKVLDLPSLVKAANDLSAALSRLSDAGPGKKEERQQKAERSASSGLFAAPAAPRMTVQ